jgi:hypothetical protein
MALFADPVLLDTGQFYNDFFGAMNDYLKLHNAVIAAQEKHHGFFERTGTTIAEYVEITDGLLPVIKFKNNLPQEIIDEVLRGLGN